MLFITELFERYTGSVARTFLKLAEREAEASRKAWSRTREVHRSRYNGPEADVPEPAAAPPAAERPAPVVLRPAPVQPEVDEAAEAAAALMEKTRGALLAVRVQEPQPCARDPLVVPMGVRGDVVNRYVDQFRLANGSGGMLVDRLRKDKKVRVAELQFIVADVLGEPPTPRKKGEYLDVLRGHFATAH